MGNVRLLFNFRLKANWYIQWASYNAKSEIVPWYIGIEAGIPRGAYSAPSQKVIRLDTTGNNNFIK